MFSSITLPLTLHEFRRFYYDIYSSRISWIYRDKRGTYCLFCKMVIDKTILMQYPYLTEVVHTN